jgi:hypothetical protein
MLRLKELFDQWGIDSGEIAGAWFGGEIPIADTLINRLIAARLTDHPHVGSVQVTLFDADEAIVRVEPRVRLMPAIPINVRIEQQPDLPRDPILRLRWSIAGGRSLTVVAGAITSFIKSMPPGVQMDRDLILIDLETALRARGLDEIFGLLHRVSIHTRPGVLLLQVEAGLR